MPILLSPCCPTLSVTHWTQLVPVCAAQPMDSRVEEGIQILQSRQRTKALGGNPCNCEPAQGTPVPAGPLATWAGQAQALRLWHAAAVLALPTEPA